MLNRAIEEGHLRQARSHIAVATARIASQCLLISQLEARGLDTSHAETCLRTMQHTLSAMREHQHVIEDMVGRRADSPSRKAR